MALLWRFEAKK